MNLTIDVVREALLDQKKELTEQLDMEKRQVKETEKTLKRVTTAVNALNGGHSDQVDGKPCANKRVVIDYITTLLADNGSIERSSLKGLVESKARENGMSASVIGVLMKYALREPQFLVSDDDVVTLSPVHATSS